MGWGAFGNCTGLTNVIFPKRTFGFSNCFEGCRKLKSFTIDPESRSFSSGEDGVLFNRDRTVLYWHPIAEHKDVYVIPDGVKRIGHGAFKMSVGLTEIHIPDSVTVIGIQAFVGCKGLTQMTIPNSVTEMGDHVFVHCSRLRRVKLPDAEYKMGFGIFMFCPALTEVDFVSKVAQLGGDLFRGSRKVERLLFRGNAPKPGANVFKGTPNATVFHRSGTKGWGTTFGGRPTAVWDAPFPVETMVGVEGDFNFTANKLAATVAKYTGQGGDVVIPATIHGFPVVSIGATCFFRCGTLTSLTIPVGVTNIGQTAIAHCQALTNVVIPATVATIRGFAFENNGKLATLTIPEHVVRIEERAFSNCRRLGEVVFKGNAPKLDKDDIFHNSPAVVVYSFPGTTGWGETFGGRPMAMCRPDQEKK